MYLLDAVVDRALGLPKLDRLRERRIAKRSPEVEGLPPARLRVLVDGSGNPDWFLRSGAEIADLIRSLVPVEGRILDFGCGCGRVARHLPVDGCDYNPELVKWCAENLPGEFRVNGTMPPAPYESGSFDVVYAISILTHFSEEQSEAWVAEWKRLLRPGGTLLVTTHGDAYRSHLGRKLGPRYDSGEVAVHHAWKAGRNICSAFHPPPYMRTLLGNVEAFRPGIEGQSFKQDIWVSAG